jgi:hypothetical protein
MKKFGILLILIVVVSSSLSFNACAICSTCGGEQDWSASANNFIEGKPINDTPSSLSLAQQWRLRNTEYNSSLLRSSPSQASNEVSNPVVSNTAASNAAVTPTHNTTPILNILNIVLNDRRAMPNPANFSDPVMITADFGNNSSINETQNGLSTSADLTNMAVYADIKNSAGTEIARVNMQRTSGNEYAGIWTANVAPATYNATIDASGSGGSKTFNDALQIVVNRL